MEKRNSFFASSAGKYVIIVICAAIIWGLMALLLTLEFLPGVYAVIAVCGYFGWKALNRIQPDIFVWMPLMGWVIYFVIKLCLAAMIGLFIAPFQLGKMLGGQIHSAIQ